MLPVIAVLLALSSQAGPILFKGHPIKVTGASDRDHEPAGPISVCVEIAPKPACYVVPKEYSYEPNLQLIQLTAGEPAILFSAESYGMSGWRIHVFLLRLNRENELENILPQDAIVANQSQHAVWDVKTVSGSKIFVTANYFWGPDEGHYGQHRYVISTYRRKEPAFPADTNDQYYLYDQYMTARKYDLYAKGDALAAEKPEILARLKRAELKAK